MDLKTLEKQQKVNLADLRDRFDPVRDPLMTGEEVAGAVAKFIMKNQLWMIEQKVKANTRKAMAKKPSPYGNPPKKQSTGKGKGPLTRGKKGNTGRKK